MAFNLELEVVGDPKTLGGQPVSFRWQNCKGMPGVGQPRGLNRLSKQPKIWESRKPREFEEQCKMSDMQAFERLQYSV